MPTRNLLLSISLILLGLSIAVACGVATNDGKPAAVNSEQPSSTPATVGQAGSAVVGASAQTPSTAGSASAMPSQEGSTVAAPPAQSPATTSEAPIQDSSITITSVPLQPDRPSDFVSSTPPDQQPAPDEGVPMHVQPGKLTVTLNASSYSSGVALTATIANGTDRTVYTADMKSDCSIMIVERQDGGSWQPLPGCNERRAPATIAVGPRLGRTATINPLSANFGVAPGSSTPAFSAGIYRIKFTYRLELEPEGEEPNEVYSNSFEIHP
jgi:hypothetical protein